SNSCITVFICCGLWPVYRRWPVCIIWPCSGVLSNRNAWYRSRGSSCCWTHRFICCTIICRYVVITRIKFGHGNRGEHSNDLDCGHCCAVLGTQAKSAATSACIENVIAVI